MGAVLPGFEEFESVETRKCTDCPNSYPLTAEYFRPYGTGGKAFRAKCRPCEKKYNENLARLRKFAPPKPDRCDVLGTVIDKLHMDHDHDTDQIRGWVSDDANIAIARLGDKLKGVLLAFMYMVKADHRAEKFKDVEEARKAVMQLFKELGYKDG